MKVFYPFVLVVTVVFALSSCSKDDDGDSSTNPNSNKPTVSLNGDAKDTLSLNQQYVELGATAVDADGKDISSSINISGAVDYNKTGLYVLRYTATDSKNVTSDPVKREVLVKNDADYLKGVYTATHKCGSSTKDDFQTTISISNEVNNRIFFSQLIPIKEQIEADVSGVNLTILEAYDANSNRYEGSGNITNEDIVINFDTDFSDFRNCTITLPR